MKAGAEMAVPRSACSCSQLCHGTYWRKALFNVSVSVTYNLTKNMSFVYFEKPKIQYSGVSMYFHTNSASYPFFAEFMFLCVNCP
jgi:hypothetical protein